MTYLNAKQDENMIKTNGDDISYESRNYYWGKSDA